MSFPESEPLSSLQAVRKVVNPDISLQNLLTNAKKQVDEIDPIKYSFEPIVYAVKGLRATIFKREIPAGETADEMLLRLYTRMKSSKIPVTRKTRMQISDTLDISKRQPIPLQEVLRITESVYKDGDGPLVVRANKIVISTKPGDVNKGTELALEIDDGSGADVLRAQRDMILTAEKDLPDGRKLKELADEPINPLHIPFLSVPLVSKYAQDDLIASLSVDLPVTGIEIGPVAWKLSTVANDDH